jgi:hypothetical protein
MRVRYQAADERWRDDATKERYSVVFKYINISEVNIKELDSAFFQMYVNIEKIFDFEILGIELSADIVLTVYLLYRTRKERYSVVFKYINISDMNIDY